MFRFLDLMLFKLMQDAVSGADAGGGGTAVATEPTPASTGTSAPATETTSQPSTPAEPVAADPNDPMAGLDAAMKELLPADDAAITPADGQQSPAGDAIAPYLQLSPYVDAPEKIQSAIAAANEVWDVATGKVPAPQLFEGLRAANPQGFEKIIGDLVPYIEQVTGKKFGEAPATPPDPNQARLDALEQRIRMEDDARQQQQYQQQVVSARTKATEFITSKAKGTFAEGNEAFILAQCAAKVNMPEQEMVNMLLQGKTDKLEAAYRAVVKDEVARLKTYNANLIKQHKTLKNAVPATGVSGGSVAQVKPGDVPAKKEGESTAAYAKRLWDAGVFK